jgi:hypothetical protein
MVSRMGAGRYGIGKARIAAVRLEHFIVHQMHLVVLGAIAKAVDLCYFLETAFFVLLSDFVVVDDD